MVRSRLMSEMEPTGALGGSPSRNLMEPGPGSRLMGTASPGSRLMRESSPGSGTGSRPLGDPGLGSRPLGDPGLGSQSQLLGNPYSNSSFQETGDMKVYTQYTVN
jgi:hypothetical protein